MSRGLDIVGRTGRAAVLIARASLHSVASHWALATVSVAIAFGVWMAVQDVENPRRVDRAPSEGTIPVEPLNVPDGYLVPDIQGVEVRVEARDDVFAQLLPSDFKATVDMQSVPRDGSLATVQVQVTTSRAGVRVVSAPSRSVRLVEAIEREVQVTVNVLQPLPTDFEQSEPPTIEPAFVIVRGTQELVDQVDAVEIDVDLSGARTSPQVFTGPLVARSQSGNTIKVQIDPDEAKVTYHIEPVVVSRDMAVEVVETGDPATGYRITRVTVDPPIVRVSGPKAVIDGLQEPLSLEPIDITNAKTNQAATKAVDVPENVTVTPRNVVVRIEIGALELSTTTIVAVSFEGSLPAGLQVQPGFYSAEVLVTGPAEKIAALKVGDIKATVSLDNAQVGTSQFTARVTAPSDLRTEVVRQPQITIIQTATTP